MTVLRRNRSGCQMRWEQEQTESPPDISAVAKIMEDKTTEIFEDLVASAVSGDELSSLPVKKVLWFLFFWPSCSLATLKDQLLCLT